jgi:hypothetical protein
LDYVGIEFEIQRACARARVRWSARKVHVCYSMRRGLHFCQDWQKPK